MTQAPVVALIGSPYQALSFLEYVQHVNVTSGIVFVNQIREPGIVLPVFHTLGHLHGFTYRLRARGGFGTPGANTGQVAAEIAEITRAEAPDAVVVIGDYRETLGWRLARDLVRSPDQVVVLDDGLATISIDRINGGVAPLDWSAEAESGGFLPLPAVTFFTAHPKQLKASPGDVVLENNWAWLRRLYGQPRQSNSVVLVIGQGLARVGLVDEALELRFARELIRHARALHPTCTPLYAAHRGESIEKLRGVAEDCEVVRFDVPIELVPIQAGILPAGIVGNYSTALTSLAAIAPEGLPIHAVRLPIDQLLKGADHVAGVYDQLEAGYSGSITVIGP